jgi:hypothetical protein
MFGVGGSSPAVLQADPSRHTQPHLARPPHALQELRPDVLGHHWTVRDILGQIKNMCN